MIIRRTLSLIAALAVSLSLCAESAHFGIDRKQVIQSTSLRNNKLIYTDRTMAAVGDGLKIGFPYGGWDEGGNKFLFGPTVLNYYQGASAILQPAREQKQVRNQSFILFRIDNEYLLEYTALPIRVGRDTRIVTQFDGGFDLTKAGDLYKGKKIATSPYIRGRPFTISQKVNKTSQINLMYFDLKGVEGKVLPETPVDFANDSYLPILAGTGKVDNQSVKFYIFAEVNP